MGYKRLSTATLMSMPKRAVIEILRNAEHNFFGAQERLERQAKMLEGMEKVVRCKNCVCFRDVNGYCYCVNDQGPDKIQAEDFYSKAKAAET